LNKHSPTWVFPSGIIILSNSLWSKGGRHAAKVFNLAGCLHWNCHSDTGDRFCAAAKHLGQELIGSQAWKNNPKAGGEFTTDVQAGRVLGRAQTMPS
jgi:hypothetical protein